MMSTRSKKDSADTPVAPEEIAAMQKQVVEKERRLREEARALEQQCREIENKESIIENLRRELEESRASQPSTSRRNIDIFSQPSDPPASRYYEPDHREPETYRISL
mgnify:CR=1 FL=1